MSFMGSNLRRLTGEGNPLEPKTSDTLASDEDFVITALHPSEEAVSDPTDKAYAATTLKRMANPRCFAGPPSPHDLIQEHYPHSPWHVLVCAVFLNCTSRVQLDRIVNDFFAWWPGPAALLAGDPNEISEAIKSLGFKNRRTERLRKLSQDFLALGDNLTSETVAGIHGIGAYGLKSFEIFCLGKLGETPPEDHSLVKYWAWAKANPTEYEKGWNIEEGQ